MVFKFEEVSYSRQLNLDAFPRQNVLQAMDTVNTVRWLCPGLSTSGSLVK